MAKLACTMLASSVGEHLEQVYTGFVVLAQRGLIDLKQQVDHGRGAASKEAHLRVRLSNGLQLHYDVHDSGEINERYLAQADLYFKRSYSPERVAALGTTGEMNKIHPLGLNYHVFPRGRDLFALRRGLAMGDRDEMIRQVLRGFRSLDRIRYTPRLDLMAALPETDAPPKILFMARAWDPDTALDGSEQRAADRRALNDMRARCIGMLREAFGDDFYGGFSHNDYAKRNFPKYLLPDANQATKKNYLERLRSHSICVATTGLHGSIGWKLGEYVAFSKAIITERLNYHVPGSFVPDQNYLEFDSPESCVEQAHRLYSDGPLRRQMMAANARYYDAHVRPDAMVLNTLLTAVELTK